MTDAEENVRYIRALWDPHPGQAAIMDLPARFRIVAAGRRWGKSKMAAHLALEHALENPGATVWWVSPSYQQSNAYGFDKMEPFVSPDVVADTPKRTEPRAFTLNNGSTVSFRSAEREDSLRGPGIDFLVIDEAGSVPRRAWVEELRPALADTQGQMLAIGTPRGRNWFYDWYQRGQSPDHPNVGSVRAPTEQNPHVPAGEIEDAREDMPDRKFNQEFRAEFVDDTGGVFRGVREHVDQYDLPIPPEDATEPFAVGVDLARTHDYTVIAVLDAEGRLVAFDRLREVSWTRIQTAVENVAERYQPCTIAADATRDNKLVSDWDAAGLNVEPVSFTTARKQTLVENLAAGLESGEVTLSSDAPALINELEVYEYDRTDHGNVRYGAPSGHHDDTVDALALAFDVRESAGNQPGVALAENPFAVDTDTVERDRRGW